MNRNLKELFRMLGKKTQTGSDYTGTVTKVKGKTAYVQFTGSDITDTPVSMSIDCKSGDHVRVRVNGGKAWITGNDTAPPSNDKEKVRAVQKNTDKLSKRIKAVEDGVEMKGIVHFKDLESDEETTINGGVINCNELKARDKLIVYGDVWEEQWDDEREDYISVDTGVDKEFEVVSFAQISPIFSLMYAFQGIDKVIIATPTDECPDPEIQTHHLTVSYVVSGGCSLRSDARMKKDVEDITNGKDLIMKLSPVTFRWKEDDEDLHAGFIAQEVQKIVSAPSGLVHEEKDGKLSIAYTELIAPIVSMLKEHERRITKMEKGG